MSSDRFPIARRFMRGVFAYWRVFAAMALCMALAGIAQPLLPWMLAPLLDSASTAAASTATAAATTAVASNTAAPRHTLPTEWLPVMMFGVVVMMSLANYGVSYFGGWLDATLQRDYRMQMARRLVRLPYTRLRQDTSGMLTSRFMQFLPTLTGGALPVFNALVQETLKLIGYLALMFYWQWQLALIVLLSAPIAAGVIRVFGKRMKVVAGRAQRGTARAQSRLNEAIGVMPVIKMSGQASAVARLGEAFDRLRGNALRICVILSAGQPINHILVALPFAIVVAGIITALDAGEMTSGEAASFLTIMLLLPTPVRQITRAMHTWEQMLVAAREIYGFIDEADEPDEGARKILRARGDIAFNRVSFGYKNDGRKALDDCDLRIKAGEVVALVGRSGAGKTTLCNMLPRFYLPQAGEITLDGAPLSDYTLDSLRRQIALVPQKPALLDDTIAANVAFPDSPDAPDAPDAPNRRERIARALADAAADDFTNALPDGMDTRIGENGDTLSGGQQQRLMLARAFYRDAPIVILDEPTSALDSDTEQKVKSAMRRLFAGRTALIIAHRFSTIDFAHRICLMDAGKVTQTGTAEQLRETSPLFNELYNTQRI